MRITTQLGDTQTGEPTWAERYDGQLDDVFALQGRITEEIVEALDIKLVCGEGHRIIGRSIRFPRARDIYYRALAALFSFRREDIAEARYLLSEAEQLEPYSQPRSRREAVRPRPPRSSKRSIELARHMRTRTDCRITGGNMIPA